MTGRLRAECLAAGYREARLCGALLHSETAGTGRGRFDRRLPAPRRRIFSSGSLVLAAIGFLAPDFWLTSAVMRQEGEDPLGTSRCS